MRQVEQGNHRHPILPTVLLGWVTLSIRLTRVAYAWSICENTTSSTKPEVLGILHCPLERDRGRGTGPDMYRNFCRVWTCGFWDTQADRRTDRQTDMMIAILRTPTGGEVIIERRETVTVNLVNPNWYRDTLEKYWWKSPGYCRETRATLYVS